MTKEIMQGNLEKWLFTIKFTIPYKIIIKPINIYIVFIFINFNKIFIKILNIIPNILNTNWFIDSTVTLDFEDIFLCNSDFIILSKLSEKI